MGVLKRNKGNFVVESLAAENPAFIETEFGTEIKEAEEQVTQEDEADVDVAGGVLVSIIGEFGKFQLIQVLLVGMASITYSWMNYVNKFLTYKVDYWCQRPDFLSNISSSEWLNMSAPMDSKMEFDRCRIFNVSYSDFERRPSEDTPTIQCNSWEFAQEPFTNTAIQRWSLVCDNDNFYFKTTSQSLLFAGHFAGALIAGFMADRIGRKKAYCIILFPFIGFLLASHFIDNPYVWVGLRFCIGTCVMAGITVRSVYAIEFTSGKWRSYIHHYFTEFFISCSLLTSTLLVYLVPDLKTAELVMALGLVPYLLYWIILPESPRWLIAKGRIDEAKKILKRALKMNNLPQSRLQKLDHIKNVETPEKAYYMDFLKYPSTRRNLICMAFCYFGTSMGYYGLIYNTPSFDWNIYLTFCMPAILTMPMTIIQPWFENRLGRKFCLCFVMSLAGTLLLLSLTIPDGRFPYNWPIMAFAWIGTVMCTASFGVGSLFTRELFPTTHRTMAFSIVSAGARIGSISSPFIAMLETVNPILGLAVYGFWLLAGGITSIWIWPETKEIKMPDTLVESEEVASTKNKWLFLSK